MAEQIQHANRSTSVNASFTGQGLHLHSDASPLTPPWHLVLFPPLKMAAVIPILKKKGLDTEELFNN